LKTKYKFLLIFFSISLFLKTDFRLEEDIYCCGDDHDYYSHSETLVIDFDLDYTNQLEGYEKSRYFNNNKIAPIGFVGSGILATPFIFLGNSLDKIIILNSGVNFKILFYSFSSIFYLYLSIFFLLKIKNLIYKEFKNLNVIFLFLGSGLSYYSFERFSMTHTYEVFAITMISYFSIKLINNIDNKNSYDYFLLSFFLFLSFNIRWVNYFAFLIPFFLFKLFNTKNIKLLKSKAFLSISTFLLFLTLYINYSIYGIATLNPNDVYSKGDLSNSFQIFSNIFKTTESFFIILFSKEFGILYFSPIIFFGLIIIIFKVFKYHSFSSFLGLLIYLQVFAIVIIWQSTASSYGFRYLLCLTPISVILLLEWFKNSAIENKEFILNFLIGISIFSLISTLFFETTLQTQLSTDEEVNAFGQLLRYTEPEYLTGYLKSFFALNAYLKIFVTSFLGLLFFKLVFQFMTVEAFLDFISRFGINLNDEKVSDLLIQYSSLEFSYIIFVLASIFLMTYFLVNFINLDQQKI